jgi:hypothetical protein
MDKIIHLIPDHLDNGVFSFIVFVFCSLFLIKILYKSHTAGIMDWSDVITADGPSNKVSLTKLMQLVGCVVATWVVIHMTLFDKLTVDIFAVYLAYVASSEGFNKFVTAKYGIKTE